ncbi:MAG: lipid A biosynthesis acyltransferase [Pseudomonadota bacterium]
MISTAEKKYLKNYVAALRPSLGGKFLYYCLPYRKKVVLKNMRDVLGEALSAKEIIHLAKGFYSHVFTSLIENLKMRFMTLEQIKQKARVEGVEHIMKYKHHHIKGAIFITGHFGNWEFAPIAGILNFTEYQNRFYFVRKLIATKWIEKLLFRRYYQAGLNVIPKKNSLDRVCDALEKHNGVVFVMDQHASLRAKDGIMVDFFGRKAGTFRSPAMIARYTNVPVLPVRSYRDKNGIHVLEFFPAYEWIKHENAKQELLLNTRAYNHTLEKFVLEFPDQWLWMHKRWKTT